MSQIPSSAAQPGWYSDPGQPGTTRYWDGANWTEHKAPMPPQVIQSSGTNGMAIASMVLGIIWIYWIGSVLAIIFGHVAKKQLSKPDNTQEGGGMATAGLVLGYIGVGILTLILIGLASA